MSQPLTKPQAIDLDHLRQWIGRSEEKTDVVTEHLARGLRATLFMDIGDPKVGDAVPFTAHWCLTVPVAPMDQLSDDGHPTRGGFLPPVPLPRRMWAGGEISFTEALRVGDVVTRHSTIKDVSLKSGSTGTLCFVAVDHVISTPRGTAIRERHDIVYREMPPPGQMTTAAAPQSAPGVAKHRKSHRADPVLLFRYSALTFNGHRIHYDRDYVTGVEGYPGLIVHGPLQAAFMIEMAAQHHGGVAPKKFVYRGLQPLFDGAEFSVNANENGAAMDVWVANSVGSPTMKGVATW